MSYTDLVKAELFEKLPTQACCRASELSAILLFSAHMENDRSFFVRRKNALWDEYVIALSDGRLCCTDKRLILVSASAQESLLSDLLIREPSLQMFPAPELLKGACCYRSFLKGAFLGGGTISNPEKAYRLELVTGHKRLFSFLLEVLERFSLEEHEHQRNGKYVAYFQNSESISDFLSIIGAHRNMMDFENVKIEKTVKNDSNRRSNCEEANLNKQSRSAAIQLAAIEKIRSITGFQNLNAELAEVARARLNDPGCTLAELGKLVEPPISKSAVYNRMQKLIEIAKELSE